VKVRFLDSSVFLHAYLKPRRPLTAREETVKAAAQEILRRVEGGERVSTTVVHLSEIANVLESRVGLRGSLGFLARLLSLENVEILPVSRGGLRGSALHRSKVFGQLKRRYRICENAREKRERSLRVR
jgi:predicted nucleic acid-binding protein